VAGGCAAENGALQIYLLNPETKPGCQDAIAGYLAPYYFASNIWRL
jgi:hypothetical protein